MFHFHQECWHVSMLVMVSIFCLARCLLRLGQAGGWPPLCTPAGALLLGNLLTALLGHWLACLRWLLTTSHIETSQNNNQSNQIFDDIGTFYPKKGNPSLCLCFKLDFPVDVWEISESDWYDPNLSLRRAADSDPLHPRPRYFFVPLIFRSLNQSD